MGEIKELDGSISECEFDISPEFAYHHSVDYSAQGIRCIKTENEKLKVENYLAQKIL